MFHGSSWRQRASCLEGTLTAGTTSRWQMILSFWLLFEQAIFLRQCINMCIHIYIYIIYRLWRFMKWHLFNLRRLIIFLLGYWMILRLNLYPMMWHAILNFCRSSISHMFSQWLNAVICLPFLRAPCVNKFWCFWYSRLSFHLVKRNW